MPSSAIKSTRRLTTDLSSFMFGMPYMSRPPARSWRSTTHTRAPRRAKSHAATRPAGPEPTTATLGAPLPAGSKRRGPPWAHCQSEMARSLSWMVSASSLRARLHAASHKAGHTRLVNSGMGLVSAKRSAACSHRPRHTRSFHSGIRLCSGQPEGLAFPNGAPTWQNATPHAMQRLACSRVRSSGTGSYSSSKSRLRSCTGRRLWARRPCSKNAPGFPISYFPSVMASNAICSASVRDLPAASASATTFITRS